MDGEGVATTKVPRTNGSNNNTQPTNKSNTNQSPRTRNNNNNRTQQYQQSGNTNYNEGAPRKNPANPRRGKRYNRSNKGQHQQGQVQTQDSQEQASTQTVQSQEHITQQQTRAPTWSYIVAPNNQPAPAPDLNGYQYPSQSSESQPPSLHYKQTTEFNNNQKRHRPQKSQKRVVQEAPKEEIDYNADAKIEEIQMAVDKQLNAMQDKADRLKTLQEEIRKIKDERDVKIEELLNEKAGLTSRLQQLKIDLQDTETQITTIDGNVAQLKQEKVQKIRALEEQSRALLDDKSN